MSPAVSLKISSALAEQTLAACVRQLFTGMSWSDARQLISSRRVSVNGTVCLDDARRLKIGDTIDVAAESHAPVQPGVAIVYCDDHIVVVEKPAGVQTVRRIEELNWPEERKRRQPVLQEMVEQMLATGRPARRDRQSGAKNLPRLCAVHRLDRDTSGLMLFARSAEAERELVRRFADHQIRRTYHAVVHGRLSEARTIDTWLVRDRGDGIRGSTQAEKPPADAQHAITHVRPVESIRNAYTLVECRLETGRTHQIRIHLAEIGHMLCGEKIYTRPAPGADTVEDRSGAHRQALHSAELDFEHPITKESMRFVSPLPNDLGRWIERARRRSD